MEKASDISGHDLFDNPMVRAAEAAMSEEEKHKFKRIGEELYGTFDFEKTQPVNTMPEEMVEALAYIYNQVKSGLHPSFLEDNEKKILEDAYGKQWYTKFGYVEKDLTEIVTTTPTLLHRLDNLNTEK